MALEVPVDTAANAAKLAELRAKTDRQLAEYVRSKLDIAIELACRADQERRSGHWKIAEQYQRRWEVVMAEAKRFLPFLKASGTSVFGTEKLERRRSKKKHR